MAQLNANFTASVQQGCSPLVVQFTDLSTGNPTQWNWDLGNGATSIFQNPGAIYVVPGSYTVILTVTNAGGQSTITKTNYIVVYSNPQIDFSASPTEGCAPLPVQFKDKTIAGSGVVNSWLWDFGDGNNSTVQNPLHTYTLSDTFDVSLLVTNSAGCKASLLKPAIVKINGTVAADFTYTYANGCNMPVIIDFSNESSSTEALTYQWTFGDGGRSTQQNPSHTFSSSGSYNVTLIATNTSGCSDTAEQIVAIGAAQANFTISGDSCVGEPLLFKDSSSLTPLLVTWNFGDGTLDTGFQRKHIYTAPGVYKVSMTANFGNCVSTIQKTVTIANKPTADFSAGKHSSCQVPFTVQFTNNSTGADSYIWKFGDTAISTQVNPSHTYQQAGQYSVRLIAFNSNGCTDTLIKDGFVNLGPPQILGIDNLPASGCAPLSVKFKPNIYSPESIVLYQWTFGDGSASSNSSPLHIYSNTGAYDVSLIVTTQSGCADTLRIDSAVLVGTPPAANFDATPRDACAFTPIQFTDLSTGTITSWQWDFGDGGISFDQNPIHVYGDTGYFTVQLIVANNGCADTITFIDYIHTNPPVAKFTFKNSCSNPYDIRFIDNSIDALTWHWDFGDGDTSSLQNPSHTYAATGLYTVMLTVTNGSCSYTTSTIVPVSDNNILYNYLPANFCKYDSVTFIATNFDSTKTIFFNWNFGDGNESGFGSNYDTIQHSYKSAGTFTPFLISLDSLGCIDTVYDNSIQVIIYGPTARFTNLPGACVNSSLIFSDSSYTDNVHPIVQWIWEYGDSAADTLATGPFNHIYTTAGTYDVQLTIFDNNGCKDSILKNQAVIITDPVAYFSVSNPVSCSGSPVQFLDSSQGLSLNYLWDFGDGTTATDSLPSHLYSSTGNYSVGLKITDQFGCTDTVSKQAIITIVNPLADFTLTDSVFFCPPVSIQPNNLSQNFSSLLWNFGDGNTSAELSPLHVYTLPGNYTLTLIAQGYGTCYDTVSKYIILQGPKANFTYSPLSGCNPLTTIFNITTTGSVQNLWDFGNGLTLVNNDTTITYTYTTPGTYLPKLIVTDAAGCAISFVNADTITVYGVQPEFVWMQQNNGCDSVLINFSDSSITAFDKINTYNWNFGDSTYSSLEDPYHYYKKSGAYIVDLTISTIKGCTATYTDTLDIQIHISPDIAATIPDSACVLSPVSFEANNIENPPGKIQWLWLLGNGDSSIIQNTDYTYTTPGNYLVSLYATNEFGCQDFVQQSLTIMPLPPIDAGIDSVICRGQSITLLPSGADSYAWIYDASLSCTYCTNTIATPDSAKTYFVTGNSAFGCKATDSILIEVKQPANIFVTGPDSVCYGNSVQLSATGAELFTWQPSTGVSDPQKGATVVTPLSTTTYSVIGTDTKGCFHDTAQFTVHVVPYPEVNIAESLVSISIGSGYQITTTGSSDIVQWTWSPPNGLSCFNCPQPYAQPQNTTAYQVTVANSKGCVSIDRIKIEVFCNKENFYIPNTFSPNGDNMNDYFYPRGTGLFTIKSFRIFNRWGQIVYEKVNFSPNDAASGWDGKYDGAVLKPDVFVYVIELVCGNGFVISTKGNVTLLR